MSKGDLYTIVTNKKVKGKAGSILVILAGTKADYVLDNLIKIPSSKRTKAKEITL
ncbi:MAG TPA: DDE transposase, partial [Tenacibaculum sp.]|nr:DDE transposase [Tenacibaculum sp.]